MYRLDGLRDITDFKPVSQLEIGYLRYLNIHQLGQCVTLLLQARTVLQEAAAGAGISSLVRAIPLYRYTSPRHTSRIDERNLTAHCFSNDS